MSRPGHTVPIRPGWLRCVPDDVPVTLLTRALALLAAALLAAGTASPATAQEPEPPRTGPDPSHGTISGRVVDDTGAAAAGACVSSQPTSGYLSGGYVTGYADSEGRYTLSVPAASYALRISSCSSPIVYAMTFRGGVDRAADSEPVAVAQGQTSLVDLVAPRSASISGRVLFDDGSPGAGQCVRVVGSRMPDDTPSSRTADDGSYTVEGVAPGPRRVHFGDCTGPDATNGQWYRDAVGYDTATPLEVAAGSTLSGIDGAVRRQGVLHGRVLDEQGEPVVGACAQVKSLISGFIGRSGCTDAEGRWSVRDLRPSSYKILITRGGGEAHADLVPRWYPGVPDELAAAPVLVSPDVELPTLDVTLPRGGRLSGRVTDLTGQPLVGACAAVVPVRGSGSETALTAADGSYTIRGIDAGAYYVHARRCNAGNWAPQWFGTSQDVRPTTSGLQVQLGGEVAGIDIALEPGARITGRVVDTAGAPLPGLCAQAYGGSGQEDASTDADGRYTLVGLPTSGSFYVSWRDCRTGRYATEYSGGGGFAETAKRVQTRAATTTELPDAVLELAGSVSGAISDERTGLRVGRVGVELLDADTGYSGGYAFTDVSGLYRVTGLKPGRWKVRFYDGGANLAASEFWDDAATFTTATAVEVVEGADRPGVDAQVLLITVPSVPRLPEVLPDEEGAVVTWHPPLDDGSAAIERYDVLDTAGTVLATAPGDAEQVLVTGLTAGRSYALSVRAANRKGAGPATEPLTVVPRARAVTAPAPGQRFSAVPPARLLDTRTGRGRLAPRQPITLDVTGRGGVPASGVRAIVLNTTVTGASGPGHLTVYPGGSSAPNASSLNFSAGQTVPNLVTVPVAPDGTVRLVANAGSPHVLADVVGWYGDGASLGFAPLPPSRVLDSRDGTGGVSGRLVPGRPARLVVAGAGGVPNTGVRAAVLNVTAIGALASGHLTAFAGGAPVPLASHLNYTRGQTVPNLVVVPVAPDGTVSLLSNAGSPHVVADIVGWYGEQAGQLLHPLRPARVIDTRLEPLGRLAPAMSRSLSVLGRGGVPTSGVTAVVVNITATGASAAGHLTVHPGGSTPPEASNLNYRRGQTVANLVVVPIGPDGTVELTANAGSPHVVGDLVGWFGAT